MSEPETLDPVRIAYEMMARADVSTKAFFGGPGNYVLINWTVADAANSPMAHWLTVALSPEKYNRESVAIAVTHIYAALRMFALPDGVAVGGAPDLGGRFYRTPLGHALLKAEVYGSDDELVTPSDAAKRAKVSLSSLSQYVSRGTLAGYPDPTIPNRMFVRRNELDKFIAERKTKRRKSLDAKKK